MCIPGLLASVITLITWSLSKYRLMHISKPACHIIRALPSVSEGQCLPSGLEEDGKGWETLAYTIQHPHSAHYTAPQPASSLEDETAR